MNSVNIHLFGKFSIDLEIRTYDCLYSQKVTELFCYLIIHRNRPQNRELLAGVFWGDYRTIVSKKYLRKALWQLHASLKSIHNEFADSMLAIESDWLQYKSNPDVSLDISAVEEAFENTKGVRGRDLDAHQIQLIHKAIDLYRGDLLEGWFQDWCLLERERYKDIYLMLLDKLMGNCEASQNFEAGIDYGQRILSYDRAHERTHYRLMRLKYLAGNRTGAIRQYEACRNALQEELQVEPSEATLSLYYQIAQDNLAETTRPIPKDTSEFNPEIAKLAESLERIKALVGTHDSILRQIPKEIEAAEASLAKLKASQYPVSYLDSFLQ